MPSCTAVIPARGGSKGLPRKNTLDLAGHPLVAHAILAAKTARHIDAVYVSTDDAEIAAIARRYGAGVIDRPEALSGATASSESAVLHALEELGQRGEPNCELVMMIQCTSPLTIAEDLDGLVETLLHDGSDSAFIAVPFHHFLWRRGEGGAAEGINHEGAKRKRRQDLEPQYLENGAAYVMRTALFRETGERFCGRTSVHVVDASRSLEIDDAVDFARAAATLDELRLDRLVEQLPVDVQALVMDFDGVFTDNTVYVLEDGREAVRASRGDGMGLSMLRATGMPLFILSKERNPVVTARANKLKIECQQSTDDKLPAMMAWLEARGIEPASAVYVGNDVNDLECLRAAGCGVVPSDAHPRALAAADVVLSQPGGGGALRELCDLILARRATAGASGST